MSSETTVEPIRQDIGFKEFVGLIAALMAVAALAIDTMLPALPDIGTAVGIPTENGRQWVMTAYLLGFGITQLFFGTLADHFGRKRVVLAGLAGYVVFSVICAFSTTFEMLLIARILQGVGAAATRVLAVSIVRDRFSGRQMARVMSLAFIVFLSVPVIAPSIGQAILLFAPWRWIFGGFAIYAAMVMVWIAVRLPETIHAEDRMVLSTSNILHAFRLSLTNRISVGYMIAMTFVQGGLFGYINSVQQVFADIFKAPGRLAMTFGLIASALIVSSLINARIVGKFGMRIVSHSALFGYLSFVVVHAAVALTGHETIWTFATLQAGMMFSFGLMGPNFGALAMEPLGHVAGTAASVQGFCTITGGAALGIFIGQQFNSTVIPLTVGSLACGLTTLVIVLVTEKGRLFRPGSSAPPAPVTR